MSDIGLRAAWAGKARCVVTYVETVTVTSFAMDRKNKTLKR